MSTPDNNKDDQHTELKPELSFEWIKYKKKEPEKTLDTLVSVAQRQEQKNVPKEEPEQTQKEGKFSLEMFKNDPVKERIYLWYAAIESKPEMTMDEFSKVIQMPDLIETEEFLFRHPPLKFGYLWRGKNLKFDKETQEKLAELLEE